MNKKYDVCAIGNALVDYEIEVEDQFFTENEVEKGLMTLVEEERQFHLLRKAEGRIRKKQGGGSAANTIFGLSAFGGKGYYTCKVASDEDGVLFSQDLEKAGIDSNLNIESLVEGVTGKCLVMITPDAERTMNTYLGITSDFSKKEIDEQAIKDARYLFMEGFLVSSPTGLEAMKKAKEIAEQNSIKVSLTSSDPSMVKYFGEQMKEVVGHGVDLLFCNIEEAELYTGAKGLDASREALKEIAKQFVITLSEEGSLVYDGKEFIEIDPFPTKAIDSTGAGDMFAGAFLYGINNGLTHKEAGILASASSSAIVSKFGPRFEDGEAQSILSKI